MTTSKDERRNPGIKRSYLTVPAVVDNFDGYCKVEVCIPDDDDYRLLFYTAVNFLAQWFNYERTGNDNGAKVARVWKQIRDSIDLTGSCGCGCGCGDDGGCADIINGCGDCNCDGD